MKKIYIFFISLVIVSAVFSCSYAFSYKYTFDSAIAGGDASAVMNIDITGNILTLALDNTSDTTYYDSTNTPRINTSAIVGFGFDLTNDSDISLQNWMLTAYRSDNPVPVVIGDSTDAFADDHWDMGQDEKWKALKKFNYIPHVEQCIDGALYNPLLKGVDLGGQHSFFTTARLTMYFSGTPVLGNIFNVRMQRVGDGGSLVINGNPEIPVIPEPSTMFLLGSLASGLFGFAGLRRRFIK